MRDVVSGMGVLQERALLISIPERSFVFAQAFGESSVCLSIVGLLARLVPAWYFIYNAVFWLVSRPLGFLSSRQFLFELG